MADKRALLNLGLAVAVAALGALYWYSPDAPDADQPLAFPDIATATRLVVLEREADGGALTRIRWALERRDGVWRLTDPIAVAADPIAIEDLIKYLGGARSRARYAASALDAKATGIDRPGNALLVTVGGVETRHELGATEPLNYRRYVRSGDTVQLVDDLISYRLLQDAAALISKRLVPLGGRIQQLELPGRSLTRATDGRWTVSPDDAGVAADALVAMVQHWEQATASAVHLRQDGVVQAVVKVTLEGGTAPLEFRVLTAVDGLRLARADLGIEYELPTTARADLLVLPRAAALPTATPTATPATVPPPTKR